MHKIINVLLKVSLFVLALSLIVTLAFAAIYNLFPAKHSFLIEKYCNLYDVDKNIVFALIKAESNFDENAVSHAGAKGLMQLTDETFSHCAKALGKDYVKEDIFDPEINISLGVWYLSTLLEKYDKSTINAVAAYNAGSSNVNKWLSDKNLSSDGKTLSSIPFGETKRHCEKIKRYQSIYKFLYR